MSTTSIDALKEREKEYSAALRKDYAVLDDIKGNIDRLEALCLQIGMLLMAEEDPTISKFSFDANYEYDDEGSYYWSMSILAQGEDHEEDYEECEELAQDAGEQATAIAFKSQSTFEGRITVEQLREELLKS